MEPAFAPAQSPDAVRVWREILIPLADALAADVAPIARRVVVDIREDFPELFPDEDAFAANRAASEQNLALIIQVIRDGADPNEAVAPPAGIAYVREAVRSGVPPEAVLRSLRLGHRSFLAIMLERLRERTGTDADFAQGTMLLTAWSFGTVDRLSTWAGVIYQEERDRWLRSAAATQTETLETLLSGGDLDIQAAGARLRYPLDRHHVGLVAWVSTSTEDRDTFAALETAVTQAAARLTGQSLLLQPLGLLATAAWVGATSPIDPATLDDLRFDTAAAPGVSIAAGEPAAGVAGFSATHRQAVQARRVATLTGQPSGAATRYRRVALSALATADLEQARTFVAAELGALAADDPTARRLAATLTAFLDEGSSHARTARRLGIHENTVRYRIRQAQEVLGRPVDERTLELRAALRIAGATRPR